MSPERGPGGPFDESFATLRLVQHEFERLGYFFYPIAKEHLEAGVTDPLINRFKTQIKKRGMAHVAGRVTVTFSGYAEDEREIFAIPEIRAYWRQLNAEVPELPALVAYLPEFGFNGPGNHLVLLGEIEAATPHPDLGGYHVSIADAQGLVENALTRIRDVGVAYRLRPTTTRQLIDQFIAGATHRLHPR